MAEPTPVPPSAGTAVADSFGGGWNRMLYLLFRGPHASLRSWLVWGVILVIAGVGGANFGTGGRAPFDEGGEGPQLPDLEPWMIAGAVVAVALLLLLGLVWAYFLARFRFVMLEGVRTGRPQIREVYARTRRVGGQYFLVLLALGILHLLLLSPLLIAWIPVARRALHGSVDSFSELIPLLIVTVIWILALAVVTGLVNWWIYDLALPYVWLGRNELRAGLARAWSLTRERPDAVLLFLLARILVAVASICVSCVLACASCVVWILPAMLIVAAVMGSMAFPLLWIVTAPLILILSLIMMWIMATITAPIPLLSRAWSWAFVQRLDPSLPLWEQP